MNIKKTYTLIIITSFFNNQNKIKNYIKIISKFINSCGANKNYYNL